MPTAVENVVFVIKENHCFDNYFGTSQGPMEQLSGIVA